MTFDNTNPNNYDGVRAAYAIGNVGREPEVKTFENGSSITEFSLAVGQGYKNKQTGEWVDKGTAWYTVSAPTSHAEEHWPTISKGDKVRVNDPVLEVREYPKKDGSTGLGLTLTWGDVIVVKAKNADGDGEWPED